MPRPASQHTRHPARPCSSSPDHHRKIPRPLPPLPPVPYFQRRHQADIGRQTLNTWTHVTARHLARHLAPIDQAIRAEILQATDLEIDETPIDYLEPGHASVRLGQLWAYRDPAAGTCYFDWHAGRGTKCLLEILGYDELTNTIAYEGGIHTDGYRVYDAVATQYGLRHCGCLAHVRRKFTNLGPASPEVTLPVLLAIQRIYPIETQTRQTAAPPACRELIRRARTACPSPKNSTASSSRNTRLRVPPASPPSAASKELGQIII